jgi:hypothetical protein
VDCLTRLTYLYDTRKGFMADKVAATRLLSARLAQRPQHRGWVEHSDPLSRAERVACHFTMVASLRPYLIRVPAGLSRGLQAGAAIAISVEPVDGSPSGRPTGPVLAARKLIKI